MDEPLFAHLPPPPAPPAGWLRRAWNRPGGKIVIVTSGMLGFVLLGFVAVVSLVRWEAERTALNNRGRCGIGQDAFDGPSSIGVEGWQDTIYTYRYHDRTGAWIDANVLSTFRASGPVDDLPVLEPVPDSGLRNAQRTSGAENRLVWSSPGRTSEKGVTTFDVYRSKDGGGYELIIQCASS